MPVTKEVAGLIEADGKVMRWNGDKVRLDLVPAEWVMGLGEVLTFGAKKYEANLWRRGMAFSACIGSSLRHIYKWTMGEEKDPDSGLHHLLHAAVNLLFLYTYLEDKVGTDDRVPKR
jgi:dATP/dGTP diphosphohydrolase